MGKHRDLREVIVRQQGHHARLASTQGDERAERWRDPGRTVEQACNDTWTSAGDNFEPSAAELCFPPFFAHVLIEDDIIRRIPSYIPYCLCAFGSFIHLNVKPRPASIELLGDLQ